MGRRREDREGEGRRVAEFVAVSAFKGEEGRGWRGEEKSRPEEGGVEEKRGRRGVSDCDRQNSPGGNKKMINEVVLGFGSAKVTERPNRFINGSTSEIDELWIRSCGILTFNLTRHGHSCRLG
ncbi:hypothetical protein Tsubulata_025010 [Turnera subulata]|uniref:Uncharacterized protein n=1 Tax=Turnera subulata TaxID=218843 RepID=A0A9Q0FNC8_9ROSI|nr:hypothetical protein Tsubulata_025010 [Turnera subulata]